MMSKTLTQERQKQKKLRIRLSAFAWAYEYYSTSLITDAEYDALAKEVDVTIPTDNEELDTWFQENYDECTGSWVGGHPNLIRIDQITRNLLWGAHEKTLPPKIEENPCQDAQSAKRS